jgi:hypothetical protein
MADATTKGLYVGKTISRSGIMPAEDRRRVGRMLDSISAHNGIEARVSDRGIQLFGGPQFPFYSKLRFGCKLSGTTCTIFAGTVHIHGKGDYDCAEADVVLSGATEYVYVTWSRAAPAPSIGHAASLPVTNVSTVYVPLYCFSAVTNGYTLKWIHHMGDLNFDTPLL